MIADWERRWFEGNFQAGSELVSANVLHGSGATANPTILFLDETAPVGTAKYKDSGAVNYAGGNPWQEVGTWQGSASGTQAGLLAASGDLHVWLGLKNSGDQGTQFDLSGELTVDGVVAGSGTLLCITGVTRNAAQAMEVRVPVTVPVPVRTGAAHVLALRIITRIGTNPDGLKCIGPGGSHNNAVGIRLYFDATNRSSQVPTTVQP